MTRVGYSICARCGKKIDAANPSSCPKDVRDRIHDRCPPRPPSRSREGAPLAARVSEFEKQEG